MAIVLNDFVGYMLGRDNAPGHGEPWWPCNTWVFVCRDLETAKHVMESESNPYRWTHVYRVRAPRIEVMSFDAGILWTQMARDLRLDGLAFVAPHARRRMSEAELLRNARKCRTAWMGLFKSLCGR